MNIQINAVNFAIAQRLTDFTKDKIEKLYKMYDEIVGIDINYKTENISGEENKTAEVLVKVPGNDLFAGKTSKTFEQALDEAVDALKKQIEKRKKAK